MRNYSSDARLVLLSLTIAGGPAARAAEPAPPGLPPFVEQIGERVWAAGYGDRQQSRNLVWFVNASGQAIIIGPPPPAPGSSEGGAELVAAVAKLTGKPARLASAASSSSSSDGFEPAGPTAFFLRESGILYAGDLITNGPRAKILPDTSAWLGQLDRWGSLPITRVVPGRGSWGGVELIGRMRRFVSELRRQVGYGIAMERPLASIQREFLLPAAYYTWMPYDLPAPEDIAAVHRELTHPIAPFGPSPRFDASKKQALVLIGDRFHEPEHLEAGLRPAFNAAGIQAHFTVDYNTITASNLARVDLLIILRDGMVWPAGPDGPQRIWMRPEQELAVKEFVHNGKAFLNLHNSMGIYPEGGEYLKLVGGRYIGHGPLERFHVEVTDAAHPIAQGLSAWFAADEQHTPPNDIPVRIFLKSRNDDGKIVANAGWTHEPGKGRVCHLAPGHTRDALHHPMYQRALRNAIDWCLRRK